ncbi:MAG: ATP-binding protein [Gammaproteobacteria bacterium]|nr:ATP-binding protein [Gammaproteobacteria bacterium]
MQEDSARLELAKVFAAYLTEYPGLRLEYNGVAVDPKSVQSHRGDYHLGDVELGDGSKAVVDVSIIEWSIPTERALHLCDANGIALHELLAGTKIRAPGFHFTAYIKSDHFRELDKLNQLGLSEMHPDVQTIVRVATSKVKEHFRRRLVEDRSKIIERWKEEQIYPYEDRPNLDPVETAERQVFDILAVNVQSYLPSFDDADIKSKKFTFRLLAQAIRENPESVQKIIGEVLGLKKDEQDELAELLHKTPLSSIISSAKIVANRLDFLNGLESLLFEKESKKKLLERDQLHKILENEAWLFHEEFALAGSEQRLEQVLNKHLDKLGKREDDPGPVVVGEDRTGRVDLLLHKANQPRTGEYDYLIVELKRPSQKINSAVLQQIESYAMAVANDERFSGVKIHWTFVAISNEFDDYAKRKANQRNQPRGKIYDDAELNITVWAKEWSEVINDARARLHFVNKQLAYEADRDSAKAYLKKAHAKFIPDTAQMRDDDAVDGE